MRTRPRTALPALTSAHPNDTDATALAQVMLDAISTPFRGVVADQCLHWISREESAANWVRTLSSSGRETGDAVFVATDDAGQVVGFILVGGCRDDATYQGEVKVITVSQQRKAGALAGSWYSGASSTSRTGVFIRSSCV